MIFGLAVIFVVVSVYAYRNPPGVLARWVGVSPRSEAARHDDAFRRSHEQEKENQISITDKDTGTVERQADSRPDVLDVKLEDEECSSPSTPKASSNPTTVHPDVPSFSLNTGDSSDEEEDDNLPPPSFPAMNSAQRASAAPSLMLPPQPRPPVQPAAGSMPPPPRPSNATLSTSGLMLPPSRPTPKVQSYTSATASLRMPSTGPLPNRGPIPNRGAPSANTLALPSSAPIKTPNPRQKVQLTPGHSPLDWAHLVRTTPNLSGVPSLIRVTPSQLRYNNGRKGKPAWSVWQGKVYNITPYLDFHPGGRGELMRGAGKDGGKLFLEVHPWVNWDNMLGECVVGILVGETEIEVEKTSTLDDMD